MTHAASASCRRSALLCVVDIALLSPTFSHHVILILCKICGCRLNSLSDGMDIFLLCDLNRSSFSVSHRLVNATVVQLCEVVHHGRQLGVLVRVALLTCAELCSRLQLCSTARSLHSDPSLAGSLASSSRSPLAVPRQFSAPAGWSSRAQETPSASCRALPGVVVTAPLPCLSERLVCLV